MTAINSKYLRVFNAKQFKESVSEPASSNIYFTFGRCFPWIDDASPNVANTSVISHYDVWNNMVGGKRVTGNDLRHVIPRFDWASGFRYAAYDDYIDSKDLKDGNTQFYVLTDDWNVYKCLSNNYNSLSTSKPTSISSVSDFQTADGYVWKYMYSITAEEQLRYLTDYYIPVKTLETNDQSLQWGVQQNAIDGGIHNILVTTGGNYPTSDVSLFIVGDGQDANAFAVMNGTQIGSVVIDNKGTGYTYAKVVVYSPTGGGGVLRAVMSPPGGHGSDPLTELGGSNIMINMRFKNYEADKLLVTNEFRQLALIEDPLVYGTSNVIANTVVSQVTQVQLNGVSIDYTPDEYVYQGANLEDATFKGRVVEWSSANNLVKLSNVTGSPTSQLVIGNESTAARFLSSVTNPDMQPFSGKLLYIDNIVPVERAIDQAEDFKIVLNF